MSLLSLGLFCLFLVVQTSLAGPQPRRGPTDLLWAPRLHVKEGLWSSGQWSTWKQWSDLERSCHGVLGLRRPGSTPSANRLCWSLSGPHPQDSREMYSSGLVPAPDPLLGNAVAVCAFLTCVAPSPGTHSGSVCLPQLCVPSSLLGTRGCVCLPQLCHALSRGHVVAVVPFSGLCSLHWAWALLCCVKWPWHLLSVFPLPVTALQ